MRLTEHFDISVSERFNKVVAILALLYKLAYLIFIVKIS